MSGVGLLRAGLEAARRGLRPALELGGGARAGARAPAASSPAGPAARRWGAAQAAPQPRKSGGGGGGSPVGWKSLGLALVAGGGLAVLYNAERQRRLEKPRQGPSAGTSRIGGPLTGLTDHHDRPHSDESLRGEFVALYFGFCFCPDICPDELEKIAEAVDLAEKRTGHRVQPVYVTIDPERDSVEVMAEYCAEFHPRLLGLTGLPQQVKEIAKKWRVYYNKTDDAEDYLVDHSIITYFLYPDGEFATFFGKNATSEEMGERMAEFVRDWKKEHPDYKPRP